jgi:hypothetical protein
MASTTLPQAKRRLRAALRKSCKIKPNGRCYPAPPIWFYVCVYLNGMPFVSVVQRTAECPSTPYGRRLVMIGL